MLRDENNTGNSGSQGEKETNVLKSNVSRETFGKTNSSNRMENNGNLTVSGEMTQNTADIINNPSLSELYHDYRKNGLSMLDSAYNALYLKCSDNYYSSGVGLKKKYENIYKHPSAWFGNATSMWKHNKWSVALKLLEMPAKVSKSVHGLSRKASRAGESFVHGVENAGSVRKSVSGLVSVILLGGTVALSTLWWSETMDNGMRMPALQLYVNGEHVGNVRSINDVEKAKSTVETSISVSLGMPYVLDCEVDYDAVRSGAADLLSDAKLNKVFHEAAHENMLDGYCLYKGDLPVCAVEDRYVLEECIEESIRQKYPHLLADDNVQNVEYKDFIIRRGAYPHVMYVDENGLRELLSLREKEDGDGGLTVDNNIITGGNSVGTSSDVTNSEGNLKTFSVSVEAVVTRNETVQEVLPFETEYVYDDTLPEGLTTPISSGRNGLRVATYSVDYTDGKETARRLLSEEVMSQPVKAVKRLGTRPLTEEEKQYKSTGTYIYPSKGSLSSRYGWRVLGGHNEFHKGLDMMSDNGLDVIASDGGTVIQASNVYNGYGLCVMIEHDDGTITRYAHCDELYVAESQKVKQGQLIGKMGSTGFVTGVHLHFEIIKDGATVNPANYLLPR